MTPEQTARAALFQSTRPRGARLQLYFGHSSRINSFNPRAREGRDYMRRIK